MSQNVSPAGNSICSMKIICLLKRCITVMANILSEYHSFFIVVNTVLFFLSAFSNKLLQILDVFNVKYSSLKGVVFVSGKSVV